MQPLDMMWVEFGEDAGCFGRDFIVASLGGRVHRAAMSDVMPAIIDVCGVPVRFVTMGRTFTSAPGPWYRGGAWLATGFFAAYGLCGMG
jgi:hypothetical protein